MDIRAFSQLTGVGSGPAAAAVPVDTRALVSEIAGSSGLSDADKSGLIAAVAKVDSGLGGAVRHNALEQIQRLGIYLRNSASEGFPRWPMMTALRAYGMNLTNEGATQSAVVANLQGQLEQLAQGHGVTLEKAIAAAVSLPVSVPRTVTADVEVETAPKEVGKVVETIA